MKKNNLIRFAQSLVILPMLTSPLAGNLQNIEAPQNVLAQKLNIDAKSPLALNKVAEAEAEILNKKAEAIDTYFRSRNMPLAGTGRKMVEEAEKNGIDWRLLPAIAVRESTGGKFACKKVTYSYFGWGSCKINFQSNDHAIEVVAKNLGGNNPKTAHYYGDKTTIQILRTYNPPSIVPRYAEQVMDIMDTIGKKDLGTAVAVNS